MQKSSENMFNLILQIVKVFEQIIACPHVIISSIKVIEEDPFINNLYLR